MKRFGITLLVLLLSIPTVLGLIVGISYYAVGEDSFSKPTITVLRQRVEPVGYTWEEPVFGGVLYRSFFKAPEGEGEGVGTITQPRLDFALPEGYTGTATLLKNTREIWAGTAEELAAYAFLDNGDYTLQLRCAKPRQQHSGHGSLDYQFGFSVAIEPQMHQANEWVTPGDVLVLRLGNVGGSMQPTAVSELGEMTFVRGGPGTVLGFLPVGHLRNPGIYPLHLTLGDFSWELSLRVLEARFAVTGNRAPRRTEFFEGAEFERLIAPLWQEMGSELRWNTHFVPPVDGEVTAHFGEMMQERNDTDFYTHTGVDIRAGHGTRVAAPCDGVVLFAGRTAATGGTVVIGHGAGLNSYLYNLGALDVETGEVLKQGDRVGVLGNEDASDGDVATMHYEVRMGVECLDPLALETGASVNSPCSSLAPLRAARLRLVFRLRSPPPFCN